MKYCRECRSQGAARRAGEVNDRPRRPEEIVAELREIHDRFPRRHLSGYAWTEWRTLIEALDQDERLEVELAEREAVLRHLLVGIVEQREPVARLGTPSRR